MHQCIKFILFWNDTVHISDSLSVHHQQFKTVHTATGICHTDTAVCLLASIQQYPFGCCMYSLQQAYSSICLVAVCTVCNKHTAVSVWLLYVQLQQAYSSICLVAVCTVLNCWWWTEKRYETCRVSFQNKIASYICASVWFYYRNILWCTALRKSNLGNIFCIRVETLK